ncbi:hypothetical protein F5Y08DRAFT_315455 [Xylaria arbuscula]|nr:hypothetical protein F5Y08DRAFT_315455 [Xylaria arbuscula]
MERTKAPIPSTQPGLQALVPQTIQTAQPVFPSITPFTIPTSRPLNSSNRNYNSSPLLRGPIPQKGSGQDRFRQQLLKENDYSPSAAADRSKSCIMPTYTGTVQQLFESSQPYSLERPAVKHTLFSLNTTTPTCPSTQGTEPALVAPSAIKRGMSPEPKMTVKEPATTEPKVKSEDDRSRYVVQHSSLATARLSAQCQLRHFNPKWKETSGPTGFRCSVELQNKVIHGDRTYPTAYDAKQAVAEKALVHVRRLPCQDPPQKVAAKLRNGEQTDRSVDANRLGRAQAKREPAGNASYAGSHGQYTYTMPVGAGAGAYSWPAYNYNDHRALLQQIQTLFGGTAPSPAVLSDPVAAQAFLQGLALGTSICAATSAYDPYRGPQVRPIPALSGEYNRPYEARERSPAPNTARTYRSRSPRRRTSQDESSRRSY